MDVGLLFPFRNPPQWRKPWPQFYAEQLKQTQVAEELGYDTVWLTEHHFALLSIKLKLLFADRWLACNEI